MEFKLEDYLGKSSDAKCERELAARLRQLPEEERFEYVQDALKYNRYIGLKLANNCLRQKRYFEILLEEGLAIEDASSMQLLLDAVMPRLGFDRVLSILEDSNRVSPESVDKALYWLPRSLPKDDKEAKQRLKALQQRVRKSDVREAAH